MIGELLSARQLRDRIDTLPRLRFAVLPTGLQELPNLARGCGLRNFFVKRDDLTGIGLGGNKSRGLEFILADAVDSGCDTLIAGGGGEQSNHAVQCVAAANKAGLNAIIVLQKRAGARSNGNALLHEVLGGRTEWVASDPELRERNSAASAMNQIAERLRVEGHRPYVLESSLHPLSIIGYVDALLELHHQLPERTDTLTRLYITSEGAALGGLLLGAKLLNLPWEIIGLDWRPRQPDTVTRLTSLIERAAARLTVRNPVTRDDITILDSGGPAYGVGRPESWSAIARLATLEGMILDPVYTAKGMAGALADLNDRPPPAPSRVVFVHTGGVGALFAYGQELRRHVVRADRIG